MPFRLYFLFLELRASLFFTSWFAVQQPFSAEDALQSLFFELEDVDDVEDVLVFDVGFFVFPFDVSAGFPLPTPSVEGRS